MNETAKPPAATGGGNDMAAGWQPSFHSYYNTGPVALQIWKRGKWCTVAKVTYLDGAPVLAVAHKGQHGVTSCISIPVGALDYAEQCRCTWLYFRDDRRMRMGRIRLADLRAKGWLQADGEYYVPLADLEPVPWRRWPYAERVLRLGEPEPGPEAREPLQLALW